METLVCTVGLKGGQPQAVKIIMAMAAVMLVGSALSMYAGMQAAKSQSASAQAQAQTDRQAANYNGAVDRQNADSTSEVSAMQEEQQRTRFSLDHGRNVASAAESGAGMDGSNFDVLRQNAVQGEIDALNVRYRGQAEAHGLLSQANMQDYQANAAGMRGQAARTAGKIGVVSAIARGTGSMAGIVAGRTS